MKNKDVINKQGVLTAAFEDDKITNGEVYLAELILLESYFSKEIAEFFSKGDKK